MPGEGSPGLGGFVGKLTPKRLQDALVAGEDRFRTTRDVRRGHLEYYCGRWYNAAGAGAMRPVNFLAQMIHAYGPQIVPQQFLTQLRPQRAGLRGEAKKLEKLVDNAMREQDAIEQVFEPAVTDALISPFGTIYTGKRPGDRVLTLQEQDVDPGEPFSIFVEFDMVACDPSAKDIRQCLWFAHRFRAVKDWLLEQQAYQGARDQIEKMPTLEELIERGDERAETLSRSQSDLQNGIADTVELWNVVVFDHQRLWELVIPPRGMGDAVYLRFEQGDFPDGGPYDILGFHKVPANLPYLSPASIVRDIAEYGDELSVKVFEQAKRSKKTLGFKAGAEEDASALAEAEDGGTTKMDDPANAAVFDLNMVSADVASILGVVTQGYQDLAGNPALLSGTNEAADTLGQDEILNMRAGARVSYMSGKVVKLIASAVRKWAWHFQTDPVANYPVDITVPEIGLVTLDYRASDRQGRPADFTYDVRLVAPPNADPNMRARRRVEFLMTLAQMMPLFMPQGPGIPPLFNFRGVVEQLAPEYGIEHPDEIINDLELAMERLQAEIGADAWLARANSAAPQLAGPGIQDGAGARMGTAMQGIASLMPGMGMGGPPGGVGAPGPPGRPVKNQQGLRQASR